MDGSVVLRFDDAGHGQPSHSRHSLKRAAGRRESGGPEDLYTASPWRWFVLFAFSWLSMTQCTVWFTYSCIPNDVRGTFSAFCLFVGKVVVVFLAIQCVSPASLLLLCACVQVYEVKHGKKPYFSALDDAKIDLLLSWGPIVFIPMQFYVSWAQTQVR